LAGAKVRSYSRIELGQIWFWRTLLDLDVESASIELRADTTGVAWPPASTSVSAFDSMWPTGAGGTYAYADIGLFGFQRGVMVASRSQLGLPA
jgi:hypothetical protein